MNLKLQHEEANELFKKGEYGQAIEMYSFLLEHTNYDRKVDVLSNRSLAYLKFQMYNLAYQDAQAVLQIQPFHEKAIVRVIQSLWGLRKYEKALETLQTKVSPSLLATPFYTDLASKCNKFLQQSKGHYDMLELMNLPKDKPNEIGEYTGPIKVVKVPGKGRGVIATQDISPGQLILVTKPFAIVFGIENEHEQGMALTELVIQKLSFPDEELRKSFGKLSVTQTLSDNLPTNFAWSNSATGEEQILMLRGVQVRMYNNTSANHEVSPPPTGIWLSEASYLNNDCIDSNLSIKYFGVAMMMRAFKEIKKGEELTMAYRNPEDKNRTIDFKAANFVCNCRLCTFEENESPHVESEIQTAFKFIEEKLAEFPEFQKQLKDSVPLEDLMEEMQSLVVTGNFQATALQQKVVENFRAFAEYFHEMMVKFRKICELRRSNPDLNMALVKKGIMFNFGVELYGRNFFKESLEVLEAVRTASYCSLEIHKSVMDIDRVVILSYLRLGEMEGVHKSIKVLKEDLMKAFGTVDVAKMICPDVLSELEKRNISFF